MPTHYDILHVTPDAPEEVIRAAHRALSRKHHPDHAGTDPCSHRRMAELNEAYAVLSDAQRRRNYDHHLRGPGRGLRSAAASPATAAAADPAPRRPTSYRPNRPLPGARAISRLLPMLSEPRFAIPLIAAVWIVFILLWARH